MGVPAPAPSLPFPDARNQTVSALVPIMAPSGMPAPDVHVGLDDVALEARQQAAAVDVGGAVEGTGVKDASLAVGPV